jgi:hypothetical protein
MTICLPVPCFYHQQGRIVWLEIPESGQKNTNTQHLSYLTLEGCQTMSVAERICAKCAKGRKKNLDKTDSSGWFQN